MKTGEKDLMLSSGVLADGLEECEARVRAAVAAGGPLPSMCLTHAQLNALSTLLADEDEFCCVERASTPEDLRNLLARWIYVIGHRVTRATGKQLVGQALKDLPIALGIIGDGGKL